MEPVLRLGVPAVLLLTQAGRELDPIVASLAVWGQQWARDMIDDDLHPAFLVWSMHLRLDTDAMIAGRIELHGPRALRDAFPTWLRLHVMASYERLRPGPERELALANR